MQRMFTALLILFSLSAGAQAPDEIHLASWNIRNISTGSRSDAELGIIALIVFRYDSSRSKKYGTRG